MVNKAHQKAYQEFKAWVDSQVTQSEAMGLEVNQEVLPDMIEANAQAWVQIAEMLKEHTLHYQSKAKPKKRNRKGKRPNMVAVMVDLYKIESLQSTLDALQEEVSQKYQNAFCEVRVELEELVAGLLAHCFDFITDKESRKIDEIQLSEQTEEEEAEHG